MKLPSRWNSQRRPAEVPDSVWRMMSDEECSMYYASTPEERAELLSMMLESHA